MHINGLCFIQCACVRLVFNAICQGGLSHDSTNTTPATITQVRRHPSAQHREDVQLYCTHCLGEAHSRYEHMCIQHLCAYQTEEMPRVMNKVVSASTALLGKWEIITDVLSS